MDMSWNKYWFVSLGFALWVSVSAFGQDHVVVFDTSAEGETKAIEDWGLDTAWLSEVNVRRGAIFMGEPQVDLIRFSFTGDWPSTNGVLHASAQAEFDERMNIVDSYTDSHTALYLNSDTIDADDYYLWGDGVNPNTWAELIDLTRQACEDEGRTVVSVAPFNEPDYGTWQGTVSRFGDVVWRFRNDSTYTANFSDIRVYGGNTLNNDQAATWYDQLEEWGFVEEGNTHQLAGTFDNYAAFYESVEANGDVGANDELHNVMEAMVGAEYGMDVGIWWGTAERTRGEFVQASDGDRLAYAENRWHWTAASVYRAPDGAVKAFVGESERQAVPTTYRFFSKDRPVFYDGHGPQRAYDVTTTGDEGYGYQTSDHHNAECVVNITWGDDVQPVIDGRYILVARHSKKVMEIASNSTADGINIQQNAYSAGDTTQQWDVNPMPAESGGDYSYFSIVNAYSGAAADLFNYDFSDGANINQWGIGTYAGVNQQYYLEYVEDGWFKIKNRWSGKCLDVNGASTSNYANIQLWSDSDSENQQWRLIPVGSTVNFVAPNQPVGLSATANAASVDLEWSANSDFDLASYTVLRSTTNSGPYDIIARGVTDTSYTDNSANLPMTYYYVVRAEDESLNSSELSAEAVATPSGAPALLAYYDFDSDASDASGNANDGTLYGSPSFGTGKYGFGSLSLSGSGQYAMLPAELMVGVTNFTIAAWVYWDGGDGWQRIFDFGNGTDEYMFLTPDTGGGVMRFAMLSSEASEQTLDTTALPSGSWQHVAVTREGNTVSLYTNGVLAASASMTIAPADFAPVLNYLGDSQWSADPTFDGRMDELYIYNAALSGDEVAGLMNDELPAAPDVPTGLEAANSDSQVALSWNAVTGASGYIVRMGFASGGPYIIEVGQSATTNFIHTGVLNGNDYYYVVASVGLGDASTNSDEVHGIPSVDVELAEYLFDDYAMVGGTNLALTVSNTVYGHSYYLLATDNLVSSIWTSVTMEAGNDSELLFGIPVSGVESNRFFKLDVSRQ